MLQFTKMHGLGNDYIYVDTISNRFPPNTNWPAIAGLLSQRRFSIGSDGLILITPSQVADCGMRIFNADGSEGQMCGNGIRCLAKYVYEHNICKKNPLRVETLAGIRDVSLILKDECVDLVEVNMGIPKIFPQSHETNGLNRAEPNIRLTLENGQSFEGIFVNTGVPHFVTEVENINSFPVKDIGPLLEKHKFFPDKANIDFIHIVDHTTVMMRVWERGSKETLACGTGACAALVYAYIRGKVDSKVTIVLRGGELSVHWDQTSKQIFMKGPAKEIYSGFVKVPL